MLRKYATLDIIDATMGGRSNTLRREAARAVFNYTPREGYIYVRSRAISSRCNDNFDYFGAEEIRQSYKSFVGKPVFVNHHNNDHRTARGVIIDAALHEHKLANGDPDTWVEVLMEVDARTYPKLAERILNGEVGRTSMGTDVKFSKCSVCDNKATNPAEYCQHIPAMKGKIFYKYTASGKKQGVLCYEKCYGLSFFENSILVEPPADPTAYFTGVDARGIGGKVASTGKSVDMKRVVSDPDRFNGVSLKEDDSGYFVHTHRARSDSYEHPDKIPASVIDKIERTGSRIAAADDSDDHDGYLSRRHDELMDEGDFHDNRILNMSEQEFEEWAQRKAKEKGLVPDHDDLNKTSAEEPPHVPAYHEEGFESFKPKRKPPQVHEAVANSGSHPDNIVNAFHEAAKDKDSYHSGLDWYKNAHGVAKSIAKHTGHDTHTAVGLMTSFSPRTLWSENLDHAYQSAKANKAVSGDHYQSLGDGRGRNVLPGNTTSAQRYLSHVDHETGEKKGEAAHHKHLIATPKTSDFAHLMEHGGDHGKGPSRVVVDRHALSVALGRRINDKEDVVKQMRHRHNYEHVADHYRQATKAINDHKGPDGKPAYRNKDGSEIKPHQVQAVTWQHQIKKNAATAENDPLQKGRNTKSNNAWDRWKRTVDNDKIPLDHGSTHYHHSGTFQGHGKDPKPFGQKESSRKIAFGEQKAPPEVNTLRAETCPVCQEDQLYTGDRCPVCGFITPPSQFLDPDLTVHKNMDLRNQGDDSGGLADPDDVGEDGDFDNPQDDGLTDPSALGNDGAPLEDDDQPRDILEDTTDEYADDEEFPEDESPEDAEAKLLVCPNCEFQIEAGLPMTINGGDEPAGPASGDPCPSCEEAPLMSQDDVEAMDEEEPMEEDEEDPVAEDEEDPKKQKVSHRKAISTMNYDDLLRRVAVLELQNEFLAKMAGVDQEFEGIRVEAERIVREADVLNPASPVPDPPGVAPTESTEETLQPDASDDPRNLGLTPGSTEDVPADQTDTVLRPGTTLPTNPTGPNGLQDVTAPIAGTETQLPLNQTRIETDVRVGDPDNQEKAFPWTIQPKASSERSMASIRLAELRVQANLAQGDKYDLAAHIQADARLSDEMINYEINTLNNVLRSSRTASAKSPSGKVPKLGDERQSPSMAFAASLSDAEFDADDATDLFLD